MAARRQNGFEVKTPSDGYRKLAADLLLPTIEAIQRGRQLERNVGFLLSRRASICFDLLGINPEVVITRVLDQAGITIEKKQGDKTCQKSNGLM